MCFVSDVFAAVAMVAQAPCLYNNWTRVSKTLGDCIIVLLAYKPKTDSSYRL